MSRSQMRLARTSFKARVKMRAKRRWPDREPDELWEAERFVSAKELVVWAGKIPTSRGMPGRDFVTVANPRWVKGRLIGSVIHSGFVFAASPEDGRVLWRHAIAHRPHSNVVIGEDHLYVVSRGQVRSIGIEDGRTRWKYFSPLESQRRFGAPPLVEGDRLYVYDLSGAMQCVDTGNGKACWRTQISSDNWGYDPAPRIFGGLIVTLAGRSLVACDRARGTLAWSVPIEMGGRTQLQAFEGQILVNASDGFFLLNATDGSTNRFWSSGEEEVEFCLATDRGILLVLSSKEHIPTPGCPGMRYRPERLVLLDESLSERWSLPYAPYARVLLDYDPELRVVFEATSSGLGIVDPDAGKRSAIVYGLPGERYSSHFLPCRHDGELYGMSSRGVLFRLRLPNL